MIGQSMINVNSGGRGRLSGISAALFLLAFILVASSLIERIPVAALIGVMFIVVIGTFEWTSFRIIRKVPKGDAFVLVLVSVVTVLTDLAVAVIIGVIVSALVFAWEHAKHIRIEKKKTIKAPVFTKCTGPCSLVLPLTFWNSSHRKPTTTMSSSILLIPGCVTTLDWKLLILWQSVTPRQAEPCTCCT